jgi:hypothetical protein
LIGRPLVRALRERGDTVVALTRDAARAHGTLGEQAEVHEWREPTAQPPPSEAIEGADGVIHLLGEPVAQRWTAAAKRRIRDSRVLGTRQLVEAIEALAPDSRPRVLISQSAVGYYGPRGDEPIDESASPGNDFLAEVTEAWEQAAQQAPDPTRVVVSRTGVVLAGNGGALQKMVPPFRLGLGGPVGSGNQYVPWIHLDDTVGALLHALDDDRATGAVNVTAPQPVTNRELSSALGGVLHRPAVMPVPAIALKLLFGEMGSVVLTGQRAMPSRLLELGYEFAYPELEPALRDLLS